VSGAKFMIIILLLVFAIIIIDNGSFLDLYEDLLIFLPAFSLIYNAL
jgi:hypothetical protein